MLKKIEQRIIYEYSETLKSLKKRANKQLSVFQQRDKEMLAKLNAGKISYSEYIKWRTKRILVTSQTQDMIKNLSQDLTHANEIATGIINGKMADVYAFNVNYGTYEIETGTGINTSFTLYDRLTVENLLKDDPKVIPVARLDIPKDLRWNRQAITSALTQGVLAGDSIPHIADRLQQVTNMSRATAIRNARTYTTSAESKGRLDSYERAQAMGIEVMKEWQSTIDLRTRDSHVDLDGERRPIDEDFSNGLDRPGGAGPPEEVYNCRCRLVSYIPRYHIDNTGDRWNRLPKDMTYDDWKDKTKRHDAQKAQRKKIKYGN